MTPRKRALKNFATILLFLIAVGVFLVNRSEEAHGQGKDQQGQIPSSSYKLYLPMVAKYASSVSLKTGISNIKTFLERCPNNDPAYSQIRADFTIRRDGAIVGNVPCSEPTAQIPISQYTDELFTLQALKTAYYMNTGSPNALQWTSKDLYAWMASFVGGINIRTGLGYAYCCDVFDGKKYVVLTSQPDDRRDGQRTWTGISGQVAIIAHETRHAEGGYYHDSGCGIANGCDPTYDISNLGAFGVTYWLENSWMTGYLNVGIGCLPDAKNYVSSNAFSCNVIRDRFSTNKPPVVSAPSPYGGPCYP